MFKTYPHINVWALKKSIKYIAGIGDYVEGNYSIPFQVSKSAQKENWEKELYKEFKKLGVPENTIIYIDLQF